MGTFRLDPAAALSESVSLPAGAVGVTSTVLLNNARWFPRIRWIVVAVLVGFGAAGHLIDPATLQRFELRPPGLWPWGLAGILTIVNLGAIGWVRQLSSQTSCPWRRVAANIWFQIASDLIVLTVLVYRVGPTNTVIAFSYLFHITLACIFFGRRDSFLVMILSALLFLATVFCRYLGLLPYPGLLAVEASGAPGILPTVIFAVPTVFVWAVVWYLVSSISDAVRQRDHELDAANTRLMRADEEINLQMLRVTHDLKAPFSGIESNIQLLKHAHWNETPAPVQRIIGKIDARSAALRARIGDILTLGSLRSAQAGEQVAVPVELHELLEGVVQDIHGLAEEKRVSVALATGEARVVSDPRQLKILFANLISNAIVYSHDGGTVDIGLEQEAAGANVRIADHGIGIGDKALPRVFDDFFRTQEAAAFNPNSTGLGLAIVRQVARNLQLSITVDSELGKGAVFYVSIPRR